MSREDFPLPRKSRLSSSLGCFDFLRAAAATTAACYDFRRIASAPLHSRRGDVEMARCRPNVDRAAHTAKQWQSNPVSTTRRKSEYKISIAIFRKFHYRTYPRNRPQTDRTGGARRLSPVRTQLVPLRDPQLAAEGPAKKLFHQTKVANKSKWRLFDEGRTNNTHSFLLLLAVLALAWMCCCDEGPACLPVLWCESSPTALLLNDTRRSAAFAFGWLRIRSHSQY